MSSQDNISETSIANPNWYKIENDVKTKVIIFFQVMKNQFL
jgi:hypothetical protein